MARSDQPDPAVPLLRFLGGAGTVTGSKFLVDSQGSRVLVDCGLFQGLKRLRLQNWARFPVDPSSIDAVVVTHAHVDHIGYLPALVAQGFDGPVICSHDTAALAGVVLPDAAHLQEEEAAYANRKGFSKHHPALPLYTSADAERALRMLRPVPFDDSVDVAPHISVQLQPAGHILGSAGVSLTADGPRPRRLYFSGDVGRPVHPLLVSPPPPPDSDVIVVESTYGDRRHLDEEHALDLLARVVSKTAGRGGMVIIPAFAVDRTEVILMALRRLTEEGRIPHLPVYADSPMALEVLRIYRRALDRGAADVRPQHLEADPFDPGDLHEAHTPEESIALNEIHFPSVIVSASGMATGGRVLHHLARRLPDSRNSVVLVGFQAEGTRGRLLADGVRSLKMLGRYVPVRAEVVPIDGFSVHADADELIGWLRRTSPPDVAYVVHGERSASATLAQRLGDELGWSAVVPNQGEQVRLD
jgi:metallo-beta-lactamase family protein